jgi:hypothetical protein
MRSGSLEILNPILSSRLIRTEGITLERIAGVGEGTGT